MVMKTHSFQRPNNSRLINKQSLWRVISMLSPELLARNSDGLNGGFDLHILARLWRSLHWSLSETIRVDPEGVATCSFGEEKMKYLAFRNSKICAAVFDYQPGVE